MKRAVFIALGALFFVSAALQLNDPDPLYWIAVYAAAGVAAVLHALARANAAVTWLALGLTLAGALVSAPGFVAWIGSGHSLTAAGWPSEAAMGGSFEAPAMESGR